MDIKIALAEDNDFLARSVRDRIQLFEGIVLKFRGRHGRELLDLLAEDHLVDAILMDIEMPEMNGIEATRAVKQLYPQIKVIVLTVFDDDQNIFAAIQAGADGYLLKDEPPARLQAGIREIMTGGAPMSASIAARTLKLLRNPPSAGPSEDFGLTKRETEVLEHLCKGHNYQQIAENLLISPRTVRKHIENIYRKLQVHNKAEAIQKANRNNLL